MTDEKYIISAPEHIFALRQLDKFMSEHNGFIAGGCFKNLFNSERIKDVDVFFRSSRDFTASCAKLLSNSDYESAYESKNVVAFRHKSSGVILEFVKKIFGDPQDIIKQFDFTIVKFAYYKYIEKDDVTGLETATYKAMYHPDFFEHLHLHRLVIDDKIPYPMSTFNRMIKYIRYGYTPCTETKQKIINAIRSLSEDEVLVPTNFYNGVD